MRKVSALLLAAGEGKRSAGIKPLLPWRGEDFLSSVYRALEESGEINEIAVVTGHRRDALSSTLLWLGARETVNLQFSKGMMTSIQTGITSLRPEWDGVLIALVDQPQLLSEDYSRLIQAFRTTNKKLVRPVCDGKPGNPAILHRSYLSEILREPPTDRGCQFLFQRHPEEVLEVPLADRCLTDFDTVQELRKYEDRTLR